MEAFTYKQTQHHTSHVSLSRPCGCRHWTKPSAPPALQQTVGLQHKDPHSVSSLLGSSRLEKSHFQTLVSAELASVSAGKECCTFHAFSRSCSVSRKQLARIWVFKTKECHPQQKCNMEVTGKVENCKILSSLKFNSHSHFPIELKWNARLAHLQGLFQMLSHSSSQINLY